MDQPLLFLIKLAWACRYRLPILITIGFMALDVRMQLEIHVQMRRIRRPPRLPLRGARTENSPRNINSSVDELELESTSSWSTMDDDDDDEHDTTDEENEASTSQQQTLQKESASSLNSHEVSQVHGNSLNVNLEN